LKRKNLWAPWRIEYIQKLTNEHGCFICHNIQNQQDDDKNFVLWRTEYCIVVLNKFPYNNGHLLIAPLRHIEGLQETDEQEMLELIKLVRDCQKVLQEAIGPHGFNVGANFGRCAGAGLPGHMHIHVVPRWRGDTNFMSVCSDTDVVSQSLRELFKELKKISSKASLQRL